MKELFAMVMLMEFKKLSLFASIAVESTLFHFDREFFYLVPEGLASDIKPGARVLVPFGISNRKIRGFVLSIFKEKVDFGDKKIKFILDINNKELALNSEFLHLIRWMRNKYCCTFFDALKVILPKKISGEKNEKRKLIRLNLLNCKKLTKKQRTVYELLNREGDLSLKEINHYTGFTSSVTSAMIKKGILSYIAPENDNNLSKKSIDHRFNSSTIILTDEQERVFLNIINDMEKKKTVSLLYGITGSGKTSIFLKLIEEVLNKGRGVIVMVPEIALTPQLTAVFCKEFKNQVAILNSSLTSKERFCNWRKIKNGEAKVVVGTRSAVFAPLAKIGLIIMDEEHETSYKSERTPRYHAREVAIFRCKYHKALLLLASATPSVESFYMAKNKQYGFNKLGKRYGNAVLPSVSIVDMSSELLVDEGGIFSAKLIRAMSDNLKVGKQSILLLNRRGYSTFVVCPSCKEVVVCKNCSVSMSYHSSNNRLICHYCLNSTGLTEECPNCHKSQVHYAGVGIQRVEQEFKKIVPNARVLRIDSDSASDKSLLEKKINAFKNKDYDVLIGTQMIAKGLNFSSVTLVGVISADSMLYSSDFRSYERTFNIITQVVGRSGRGKDKGLAIIQTLTPENPIIKFAADQNYEAFYNSEIQMRKAMLYPPFAKICVVGFCSSSEKQAADAANLFCDMLINTVKNDYKNLPLRILGPSPAFILKIKKKYRYKIIIKFKDCKEFRNLMIDLKLSFVKFKKDVLIFIDSSPNNIP
ncbi:MAG: primosomal protein N' [Oscillospiraceae bacterium]|jgi:primosomal protein N' (replication factor Y)|nr:primosomal protein N' [Oscillospiraceae bacterium]